MIADALIGSVNAVMEKRLDDPQQVDFALAALLAAFEGVQKKPVADEAQRRERLEGRMRLMLENVALSFVNGKLVVKVDGASESLMKEFRRGSDWFVPWDKVDEILLAAILVDPTSN